MLAAKGQGDAVHAVLRVAGYNIRWLLHAVVRLGLSGLVVIVLVALVMLSHSLAVASAVGRAKVFRVGWVALQLLRNYWAAAGFVDTDLSLLSLFELYGTDVAQRRMSARRVVEALDVVEHVGASVLPASVHLPGRALGLH